MIVTPFSAGERLFACLVVFSNENLGPFWYWFSNHPSRLARLKSGADEKPNGASSTETSQSRGSKNATLAIMLVKAQYCDPQCFGCHRMSPRRIAACGSERNGPALDILLTVAIRTVRTFFFEAPGRYFAHREAILAPRRRGFILTYANSGCRRASVENRSSGCGA